MFICDISTWHTTSSLCAFNYTLFNMQTCNRIFSLLCSNYPRLLHFLWKQKTSHFFCNPPISEKLLPRRQKIIIAFALLAKIAVFMKTPDFTNNTKTSFLFQFTRFLKKIQWLLLLC